MSRIVCVRGLPLLVATAFGLVVVMNAPRLQCASSITSSISNATQSTQQSEDLNRAATLFRGEKFQEALPILEQLVASNPKNDQAVYGLGIALVMSAAATNNSAEQSRLVDRALAALQGAKALGIEDYDLDSTINSLRKNKNLLSLSRILTLHPPRVFDTDPPNWIKLRNGYRHKSGSNFEGHFLGIIWRPEGLKLTYGKRAKLKAAVKPMPQEEDLFWHREREAQGFKMEYGLTRENTLIVIVTEPIVEYPEDVRRWSFTAQIRTPEDIKDVLLMVTGFSD